jgi:hypothetical protein
MNKHSRPTPASSTTRIATDRKASAEKNGAVSAAKSLGVPASGYAEQAARLAPGKAPAAPQANAPSTASAGKSLAWQLGYEDGVAQAKGGLANIENDNKTQSALRNASAKSGVAVDDLEAMAIIESTGNRAIGTNAFGYTGLMQMGAEAAKDVGMKYADLQGKDNVENNALAGAKYWNVNDKRLNENIPRDPLHMYLAHQQGAGGTNKLMETLKDQPEAKASRNQLNNLPGHVVKRLAGKVKQQDFYDYWQGKMAAIQEAIRQNEARPK